jgi:hypothetical protein
VVSPVGTSGYSKPWLSSHNSFLNFPLKFEVHDYATMMVVKTTPPLASKRSLLVDSLVTLLVSRCGVQKKKNIEFLCSQGVADVKEVISG